jgi:translation elongation factor EF-Tu-like GTPase
VEWYYLNQVLSSHIQKDAKYTSTKDGGRHTSISSKDQTQFYVRTTDVTGAISEFF